MKLPKIDKTILVHLALFAVALIYGANYTIAKEVMPLYISPSATILMRVLGASVLFWILVGGKKLVLSNNKEKTVLLLSAIFGVVVNQLLFFEGLARTTPINAALIMTTTPLLVLIVSAVTGGEKFTFLKGVGVSLGLLGAAMLISSKTVSDSTLPFALAFDFNLGDLFILLNATSYAIYLVIAKPLLKKYSALSISKWMFTLALPFVLPFGFSDLGTTNFEAMPAEIYAGIGYIVLFTTFFAYLLNAWALRSVSSSVVGIYIYLQPVLATFIAVALDKDSLTFNKLIWAACIFLGVFLVSKKQSKKSI
ncbi:DMT family transporter [Bernardetia sp. OM2101]|uniref:DMT family transporter n=1 Tax=Bernardetia sp. OM2101 TaxID=3344876 RepID=UPI0035D13756